jgi:hypothetical protein
VFGLGEALPQQRARRLEDSGDSEIDAFGFFTHCSSPARSGSDHPDPSAGFASFDRMLAF